MEISPESGGISPPGVFGYKTPANYFRLTTFPYLCGRKNKQRNYE